MIEPLTSRIVRRNFRADLRRLNDVLEANKSLREGHVQIILNMVDLGMNLQEASDAPRIRHSGSGTGYIELESGFDYSSVRSLMIKGHQVRYGFERFGGFQGILFDGTFYYGASESRKDGQAAGY